MSDGTGMDSQELFIHEYNNVYHLQTVPVPAPMFVSDKFRKPSDSVTVVGYPSPTKIIEAEKENNYYVCPLDQRDIRVNQYGQVTSDFVDECFGISKELCIGLQQRATFLFKYCIYNILVRLCC